jgi:uncharacterized protein (TIGR00106 family)
MLVEFSVIPVGTGTSAGKEIARAVEIVEDSGLPYKLTPMGTVVEGTWDEVMGVIKKCHDGVLSHAGRVITSVKIDDRPGRTNMMETKIQSVEEALGRKVRK